MSSALLGNIVGRDDGFRLRGCYPLWHPFPRASTTRVLCNSLEEVQLPLTRPTTPRQQRPHAVALPRFRLTPVRSPLLRGSRLLSLPPGTEMFQFPGFASLACAQDDRPCDRPGFPIRKSWDHSLFAAPPGLSQLTTSFVASLCQGIHR